MSVKVINFGCRLNSFEAEIIKQEALKADLGKKKEVFIFNSCAVTNEALRQSRQAIRKIARENKDCKIIVTGCGAQIKAEDFANMVEVDFVIGNVEKLYKTTYQKLKLDFNNELYQKVKVRDIMNINRSGLPDFKYKPNNARTSVQIQNGCDHNCTFCIIPYGRGRSRSVPIANVIKQIQNICKQGCQEIVLTGVDITSYGTDLTENPKLSTLIKTILKEVPNLDRLRISSLDSIEIDDELFELLCFEHKILPYTHLSLQAGHNLILKRMKRRHLREDAINFCKNLLKHRAEMVFGADLITGFPTETEDMFQATLDLVKECNLTHLHVFPFSSHNITPASKMPQVDRSIIKDRAARLRRVGDKALEKHLAKQIGKKVNILIEDGNIGRSDDYSVVLLQEKLKSGEVVTREITSHDKKKLIARGI